MPKKSKVIQNLNQKITLELEQDKQRVNKTNILDIAILLEEIAT